MSGTSPNESPREVEKTFRRHGILFVVSAASGTGKSTLCNSLRQSKDFIYSVSCTTRAPRPGEIDGEDYHFLSREHFEEKVAAGGFIEHAHVHGNYYGTLKQTVLDAIASGTDVLLDIDAQGAESIRKNPDPQIAASLVDVFIMPPTFEELERRLRKRGTETEESIIRRLANGREEMQRWSEFKYTILSGSMEEDLTKFRAIMRAERYLSRRLTLDES
ncbi:guanylate kinase [Verrucomicrobium sp. GAS474]|uniref:guanylate kinase n=1 Tax=Verrucomicrobium sp. GAS474 TaxID=1882831 RepID=UPI00087927D2|nr:guanylate kinase [Verrucomicrobium sp. GAS474]SDU15016.1 guanylate kinase [Verrucomicrobium sp. GAS474]